ncbi:hypothetical protein CRI93_02400 [Longimonas halophila]|uniref:TonB C-terminal domain-containing protein n=2 Tax=Longimonas halophila TaxID=1469170 RepID=A0A2H3P1Z8_9BACT|nr:hypothetical protein CRI93_02400 [Longimonas halophila]
MLFLPMSFSGCRATGIVFLVGLLLALGTGCAGSEEAQAFQAMMESRPTMVNPTNYATVYPEDQVEVPPEIDGGMDRFYERVLENEPPRGLRQDKSGSIVVLLVVSPEGEPTNVLIEKSLYPVADEVVRSTVLNSSFTPGRHNGEPVPVALRLSVQITNMRISM